MSYFAKRPRFRPRRPAPAVLSGDNWWEEQLGIQSQTSACLDQANASVAPFEASIDDLDKTWVPNGFYTIADLRHVVQSALAVTQQGYAALTQAAQMLGTTDTINEESAELGRVSSQSLDYLNAATEAEGKGIAVVNAPGLKRWVISALQTSSNAMVAGSMLACMQPWWLEALQAFGDALAVAIAVFKKVVGAIIKLGELVLKIPDALDDALTIAKWALGLGLAYYLFTSGVDHHSRSDGGL